MLSRFGHVTALEFNDYAREHIPYFEKVKIFKGWLPDGLHSIQGENFDLICLFDVLEHIEFDDDSILGTSENLTKSDKNRLKYIKELI